MPKCNELRKRFDRDGYVHFNLSTYISRIRKAALGLDEIDDALWSNIIKHSTSEFDFYPDEAQSARLAHQLAFADYQESKFAFSFMRMPDNDRSAQSKTFRNLKECLSSKAMYDLLEGATGKRPKGISQFYLNRFDKGHFLNTHCDPGQSYGVVVHLSKAWDPNHGGLTTILSDDRNTVRECLVPAQFQTLIFDTRDRLIPHFVSMVTATSHSRRIAAVIRYDD